MSRKKKVKPNLGDVFTFKLENGLNCFGQIVALGSDKDTDMLHVLFDFSSFEFPQIKAIVKKPILTVANLVSGIIESGYWTIIGNGEISIASLIVLPNYVISNGITNSTDVLRYDGTWLRTSSIEEQKLTEERKIPNLRLWTSLTSGFFEYVAKQRFLGNEDGEIYRFKGSMWDAEANQDGIPLLDY